MLPSRFKELQHQETQKTISKISNDLILSFVKKNNLVSLKILFYLSSLDLKIDRSSELQIIDLDVKKLLAYCDIDLRTLRRNIKAIQQTVITFVSSTEGKARYEENINVIPYSKYDFKGTIQIKMFPKILELIIDVKNKFTVIDLSNLMNLKSKHSVRMIQLLEYLEGFNAHIPKRQTYTLFEFNSLFGTNYMRFKEIERKILLPVQEELDEFSSLSYLYSFNFDSLESVGRPKIVSVTIDLKTNRTRQLKLF